MYMEISKKTGDSPTHSRKSKEQPVIQKRAELAAIQGGSLRKKAIENSDKKTHYRYMKAGGKFANGEAFIDISHEDAIRKTEEQAKNRINNKLQTIAKKNKMNSNDKKKVAQLMVNNTGLPDNLKSGVESLSGLSMDDVKVHFNSSRPAQLHALAYTQGTDIHVAPGQEKHLPHEAWHVVQQKQHRVKPTMQIMDISVNDDIALEREADVMGAKAAVQGKADSAGSLFYNKVF